VAGRLPDGKKKRAACPAPLGILEGGGNRDLNDIVTVFEPLISRYPAITPEYW
jgi:hypothetical protein